MVICRNKMLQVSIFSENTVHVSHHDRKLSIFCLQKRVSVIRGSDKGKSQCVLAKQNMKHLLLINIVYNKENLERQETNKNGRGTERHLPKTDESIIRPAGEHR